MQNLTIDISIQSDQWNAFKDVESCTHNAVTKTLSCFFENTQTMEVSILLTDDPFIQNLNKTYREKDKPTNVLSFPQTENGNDFEDSPFISLGDIIIAYETIKKESEEQSKTLKDHYIHLSLIRCLHLLHYDHQTDKDAEEMETQEIEILQELGIKNPYQVL